jgi:hypothetical protein
VIEGYLMMIFIYANEDARSAHKEYENYNASDHDDPMVLCHPGPK